MVELKQYKSAAGLLWWPAVNNPQKLQGALHGRLVGGHNIFVVMELDADKLDDERHKADVTADAVRVAKANGDKG